MYNETKPIDAALAYAGRGWHVFPVAHRGKTPICPNGLDNATTDPDTIRQWWAKHPGANIGLACGPSNLVVIDVDAKSGGLENWESFKRQHGLNYKTLTCWTGGGGCHLYFIAPNITIKNSASKLAPGVDVRGARGYVIVPPSQHASGRLYEWDSVTSDPAPLPQSIIDALAPTVTSQNYTVTPLHIQSAGGSYGAAALAEATRAVAMASKGSRNDTLNTQAFKMGQLVAGGELDLSTSRAALLQAAALAGLGETEIIKTLESGILAGLNYPREKPTGPVLVGAANQGDDWTDPTPTQTFQASQTNHTVPQAAVFIGIERKHQKLCTDTGNGQRLVDRHGQNIRYLSQRKTWLLWDGKRWVTDEKNQILELAKDTARAIFDEAKAQADLLSQLLAQAIEAEKAQAADPDGQPTKGKTAAAEKVKKLEKLINDLRAWAMKSLFEARLNAMVNMAKSQLALDVSELDSDSWLLNVNNGTLDLRTGTLRPHNRADYITKLVPVDYDPNARLEMWDSFLSDVTGGDQELQAFLRRATGYSLTGSTKEEKLFFVCGVAGGGKSTFIEAVKMIMGDYAKTANFETFLQSSNRDGGGARGDIARLAGSRMVSSNETNEGSRLAEGIIKTLTGRDTITARFVYERDFEYMPQFKLWLVANDEPKARYSDSGLWRRILKLPFNLALPAEKRNPVVKDTLNNPALAGSAILAWAVQGCLEWQRAGLGTSQAVSQSTDDYRAAQDPLKDWLEECCVLGGDKWAWSKDLRDSYERHCADNGVKPVYGKSFAELLKQIGCSNQGVKRDGLTSGRWWSGIAVLGQVGS